MALLRRLALADSFACADDRRELAMLCRIVNADTKTLERQLVMSIERGRSVPKRLGLIGCSVALLSILGLDHPKPGPQVIDAHRFVLRDATGKIRAEFGFQSGGPSLTLLDEQGMCRARLALSADGASHLIFQDREGQHKASLLVPANGEPQLEIDKAEPPSTAVASAPVRAIRPRLSAARQQATDALYRQLCISCHGQDGRGRKSRRRANIPDFTDVNWHMSHSDARLMAAILNGRGDEMPPFADLVSKQQAHDLITFIRTFGTNASESPDLSGDDFEKRLKELRRQWDDLDRQIKALSDRPARSSEDSK